MALPATIKEALDARALLGQIALSPTIDGLLTNLHSAAGVPDGNDVGGDQDLTLAAKQHLGFLALDLVPPVDPFSYRLITDPVARSFRFWLVLSDTPPARKLFEFATGAAGVALKPATYQANGDEERLVAAPGDVSLAGLAVAILVEGKAGETATMRLSPTVGQPAGIIELQLVPPTVLIGGGDFGLEFPGTAGKPGAFVIDDSTEAAPSGQTVLNGAVVATRADDPAWRGIAVRHARFYLPSGVPLLGGHAVDAFVEVGTAPGEGIDLAISTSVPAKGSRPRIDVTIECRDPTATGLQDFIPTLVEASMELPLDGTHQNAPSGGFDLLAGKPVIARARFARSVAEPEARITLSVESQGPDGVLSVVAPQGALGARVLIAAAALATAIVADKAPAGADSGAVVLHELLVAALALSAALKNKGRLTIHKVELSSAGHGLPVGDQVSLLVDYSVDVLVQPIDIGVLSVQMRDEQPMRVRNRNVGLRINLSNPAVSGVKTVELDFRAADMEIEDPGAWQVGGPASLFDILGTRSGRGSTWIEVDLRFKLNLGPVRISGATIRATLAEDGDVTASLRGLEASLAVPGVVDGKGALALLQGGGFSAALDVRIVPLNLSTDGVVVYQPVQDSFWLFVQIGADFPGPIPIANTGLGIYGISGAFGVNARPKPPAPDEPDPIGYQLRWDSSQPLTAFEFRGDNLTIGAQAVVGTVPDLGFSFSARAGLFVTVPDVVVRGALWATVLNPRMGVTDQPPADGAPGLRFMGVVVVDAADGVTIGLKGELTVPVVLHVVVPLGAHFPTGKGQSDNWYVYLGADGYPADGRGMGPMRAVVLPDLIGLEADAYMMFRGRGMQKWPRGGPITIADGLVIAFGFGYDDSIGEKPIAWADIHASADILLATSPLTLAGFGAAGGSLNLGPFSVGVDATLSLLAVENCQPYVHAQLCGHIDLFFTEVEGCVEISINNEPTLTLPPPDVHPLDDMQEGAFVGDRAFLIDDKYRRIGRMTRSPDALGDDDQVWPDTLLHLAFTLSPNLAPTYVALTSVMPPVWQFGSIAVYPGGLAAKPVGNDMLRYEWTFTRLALYDVTGDVHGAGTLVPGTMSAAWQAGKDGDLGTRPQAGELVLLTYQGDLFLDPLADAGAGLPSDPLADASTACQREVRATEGWAVGYDAAPVAATFVLPSDPLVPDPCVSRFTATLTQSASVLPDVALAMNTAALLPAPYDYAAASLEAFAPPLLLERTFDGALDLAVVSGPLSGLMRIRPFHTARLQPEQALTAARVWLVVDDDPYVANDASIAVVDSRGESWSNTDRRAVPPGRSALRFAPVTAGFVEWIEIHWMLGHRLAVLGLGGITATAQAAAAARNAAQQAEAQRQADAAKKQPQPPDTDKGADAHGVLKPGHTYRLDVGMAWEGWLYQQDENGNKKEAAHDAGRTDYQPKGAGTASTDRSFFFHTTPKQKALAGVQVALPKYGDATYVSSIHRRRDLFDPQMLMRFLLGYTPAQTETARFCDDPLNAHFSAAHVTALAKAYGYTLTLGLRRVDAPGADGDAVVLDPKWIALQAPSLLTGADARRMQVATTAVCALPKPGGTLQAQYPLVAQAWYEVYTLAKSDDPAVLDGRLDGVTFRTSRWRNPAEMVAGIGFKSVPASGDVEVAQLPALGSAVIDGSDADFEAALEAIGLDGWPPADAPRISILWRRQAANAAAPWQCAGLLLESPEPVDRPGRCELSALRLVMQPPPVGTFDVRRSDRTRARILWLCSAPFVPHAWLSGVLFGQRRRTLPTIVLELTDKATNTLRSGSVALPLAPSFAEEA